jgi:hypothetical protein
MFNAIFRKVSRGFLGLIGSSHRAFVKKLVSIVA